MYIVSLLYYSPPPPPQHYNSVLLNKQYNIISAFLSSDVKCKFHGLMAMFIFKKRRSVLIFYIYNILILSSYHPIIIDNKNIRNRQQLEEKTRSIDRLVKHIRRR